MLLDTRRDVLEAHGIQAEDKACRSCPGGAPKQGGDRVSRGMFQPEYKCSTNDHRLRAHGGSKASLPGRGTRLCILYGNAGSGWNCASVGWAEEVR